MQDSGIPAKFPIPFAASAAAANIRAIPQASQQGVQNGAASLTDGFPPNCFSPISAGGSWPFGQDFNGLLKQVTQWLQWGQAGAPVKYDASFSAAIGGYPAGALLSAATLGKFWLSTVDNNTSNPDASGANWLPFPFSFTTSLSVEASTTWTVPAGRWVTRVRLWGAGGCGGAGGGGAGGGAAGGGYAEGLVYVTPGQVISITAGIGGIPGTPYGTTTSFGSALSATGGGPGGNGPNGTGSTSYGSGSGGALNAGGSSGSNGIASSSILIGGQGGGVFGLFGGQPQIVGGSGNATGNNGQGGAGGSGGVGSGNGGNGGNGVVIWEF